MDRAGLAVVGAVQALNAWSKADSERASVLRFARTHGCRPFAALVLALLGAPASAHADEPSVSVVSPLRWDPAWTHANAWSYSTSSTRS
jgi:hypothetical protein